MKPITATRQHAFRPKVSNQGGRTQISIQGRRNQIFWKVNKDLQNKTLSKRKGLQVCPGTKMEKLILPRSTSPRKTNVIFCYLCLLCGKYIECTQWLHSKVVKTGSIRKKSHCIMAKTFLFGDRKFLNESSCRNFFNNRFHELKKL